jgi:hypothetical protein
MGHFATRNDSWRSRSISSASKSTRSLSSPAGTIWQVWRRNSEISLTDASKCARPNGEDSSMFSTRPDTPTPGPADGQTMTSPRPSRPFMPIESRSRAKTHSTSLSSSTRNATRMAYGSSRE